jgi:hypothetical protein
LEQGCGGSNVLARLSEVRETVVILDDPLVHVAGDGARTPSFLTALDLALELRALLL